MIIREKICSRCKACQSLENFGKDKNSRSGLTCWCKTCKSETRKERYLKVRDKELSSNRAWKAENRERLNASNRLWKKSNKEYYSNQQKDYRSTRKDEISAYSKVWYQENKDSKLALGRQWYSRNKDYKDTQNREWRKANPEKVRLLTRLWRMVNKDLTCFYTSKYRASKLQATPLWLNESDISEMEDFYTAAQMFKTYTGIEYHVDHIVPLQGKKVCGLHVPWNLQLLPWNENLSKSNKFS